MSSTSLVSSLDGSLPAWAIEGYLINHAPQLLEQVKGALPLSDLDAVDGESMTQSANMNIPPAPVLSQGFLYIMERNREEFSSRLNPVFNTRSNPIHARLVDLEEEVLVVPTQGNSIETAADELVWDTNCISCYDSISRARSYCCSLCHSAACSECLSRYLEVATSERRLALKCMGYECAAEIDVARVPAFVDPEIVDNYARMLKLQTNINLRECPQAGCRTLISGSASRPNMECTVCRTEFCFHHGLAHVGQPCDMKRSRVQEARVWFWKKRNTRPCPRCHSDIEKNGGCNHMTCRCGYEMCWMCGGDYNKNGRRGHNAQLFPSPRNLKYCCNDWKAWTKRVTLSVVAVPLASIALGVAVCSLPVFGGVVATRSIAHKVEARRSKRRAQKRRLQMPDADSQRETCRNYYTWNHDHNDCRFCSGEMAECDHHYPAPDQFVGADPTRCFYCNHFNPFSRGCFHVDNGSGHCMFCAQHMPSRATSTTTASSSASSQPPHQVTERDLSGLALRLDEALHSRRASIRSSSSSSNASEEEWSSDEEDDDDDEKIDHVVVEERRSLKDHMEVEVEEVEVGSLFHDVDLEEQAAALASLDHGNKRCSVAFASCPDLSMHTRVEFIAVDGFGSSDA